MTYAGPAAADAPGTRTGGVPHVPADFTWPLCAECDGPMQFVAQVSLADAGLLSIFMCQNDPGLCEEWDATAGGNHAYVFGADAVHFPVPPADDGVTALDETCAVDYEELPTGDYLDAADDWHKRTGRPKREVLGQIGGRPLWLQSDETPVCDGCNRPMAFVVQLEEGHNHRTSANFGGGGCGYAFHCAPCSTAAFLWQC
ncbi:hypothetical protein Ahu01nite_085950 [Winogradskya humida]|uniref:DUF1963 domain-containing protein n=2 Tax=Winogradskya humida TaxID=113566 RepID=A0ABQ4A4E6_9ACTN|nr:hypothetical protein Ahu01nite_085950 [Actinoplanes humidus]